MGQNHNKTFMQIKELIKNHPVLAYFNPHKEPRLQVDASKCAIMLQDEKPKVYASKSLNCTEVNYAQKKSCMQYYSAPSASE